MRYVLTVGLLTLATTASAQSFRAGPRASGIQAPTAASTQAALDSQRRAYLAAIRNYGLPTVAAAPKAAVPTLGPIHIAPPKQPDNGNMLRPERGSASDMNPRGSRCAAASVLGFCD